MKALRGHFNGEYVVLDEPTTLKPNTKVTVVAADTDENQTDLTDDYARLSEGVFKNIWDNSLDADYDKL